MKIKENCTRRTLLNYVIVLSTKDENFDVMHRIVASFKATITSRMSMKVRRVDPYWQNKRQRPVFAYSGIVFDSNKHVFDASFIL